MHECFEQTSLVGRVGLCQAIAMWREQECSVLWESHCVALIGGRLWDDDEVTCSCMCVVLCRLQ